jgi:hypothetical protein
MTDQRPGASTPAGPADPTRVETAEEPSMVDAPVRWSGAAPVPPPAPKKPRWSRRPSPEAAAGADPTDWATIPPVDPWEGQDTPIDPFPVVLEMPEPPPAVTAPPPPPKISKNPKISKKERRARERAERELVEARERMARQRLVPVTPPVSRLPVQTRPALPEPPPWVPREPRRPLPAPPRRKRRWGRRFALLSLFGLVCCCGGPIAWFQFPAARQYPVRADLPSTFADLSRRDDSDSTRAADRLAEELRAANARTDQVFTGVYGDGRGKRVTVFGVTGWRFTPGSDVRTELDRLADDFRLSGVRSFDLGEPGAHESCGVGRLNGDAVVVCSWADHGSLATVLLTRRSLSDSADLVGRLRSTVLSPG